MRITLEQAQIQEAMEDFLKKQGLNLTGKSVETTFTVGRGANPTTVEIVLSGNTTNVATVPTNIEVSQPTLASLNTALVIDAPENPPESVEEEAPVTSTKSLFPS